MGYVYTYVYTSNLYMNLHKLQVNLIKVFMLTKVTLVFGLIIVSGMPFSHSLGWEVLGRAVVYSFSKSKIKSKQEREKMVFVSVVVVLGVLRASQN